MNSQHNVFKFSYKSDFYKRDIIFSSNFDSGNLGKVEQISLNHVTQPKQYILYIPNDCVGTDHQGFSKSWFYFSVQGAPYKSTLKFTIKRIHMLASVSKYSDHYKPVYKIGKGQWARLQKPVSIISHQNQTQLLFQFTFETQSLVYFAFSYPFSYHDSQKFLSELNKFRLHKDIYYHNQILIKSPQGRNINLLTISSSEGKIGRQKYFNQYLFPQKNYQERAMKFRPNKPVVLITARVHPGQTPGSYVIKGILKFLLCKQDARAILLRKYFVFMIIPMLNPDGVYHGHYRMDIFNQNLNRYYKNPDPYRHSSVYAIKQLSTYLAQQKRLLFYFDLHAHASKKGCFFYGNSLDDFYLQVENQLFAKLLSMNCVNFEYDNCNFTKKQMSSKDRFQELTKEGCGRVVIHKTANLVFSYTLQCGFHNSTYLNQLPHPINAHRKYENGYCIESEYENIHNPIYANGPPYYCPQVYENVGKAIMITILDIFDKNPYSRLPNSYYKLLDNIRKQVGMQVTKNDKFRKEQVKWFSKLKKITETVNCLFYDAFQKNNVFFGKKRKYKLFLKQDKEYVTTMKEKKNIQRCDKIKFSKTKLFSKINYGELINRNLIATSAKSRLIGLPLVKKEQKKQKLNRKKSIHQKKRTQVFQIKTSKFRTSKLIIKRSRNID